MILKGHHCTIVDACMPQISCQKSLYDKNTCINSWALRSCPRRPGQKDTGKPNRQTCLFQCHSCTSQFSTSRNLDETWTLNSMPTSSHTTTGSSAQANAFNISAPAQCKLRSLQAQRLSAQSPHGQNGHGTTVHWRSIHSSQNTPLSSGL